MILKTRENINVKNILYSAFGRVYAVAFKAPTLSVIEAKPLVEKEGVSDKRLRRKTYLATILLILTLLVTPVQGLQSSSINISSEGVISYPSINRFDRFDYPDQDVYWHQYIKDAQGQDTDWFVENQVWTVNNGELFYDGSRPDSQYPYWGRISLGNHESSMNLWKNYNIEVKAKLPRLDLLRTWSFIELAFYMEGTPKSGYGDFYAFLLALDENGYLRPILGGSVDTIWATFTQTFTTIPFEEDLYYTLKVEAIEETDALHVKCYVDGTLYIDWLLPRPLDHQSGRVSLAAQTAVVDPGDVILEGTMIVYFDDFQVKSN
jgi:hypothetical protein